MLNTYDNFTLNISIFRPKAFIKKKHALQYQGGWLVSAKPQLAVVISRF